MTGDLDQPGRRTRPRVVIVGGGFGGLQAARGLKHADADVVVVDRVNHHLFQPLLYQVSTALLAPGDIAPALRTVLARQDNASVVMGEVTAVDPEARTVETTLADGRTEQLPYGHLVLSAGSQDSYFGHDEWAEVALPMKTLDQAVRLRTNIFRAFEAAAVAASSVERRTWLTFVIVGAGPTGVEVAGQIAALARRSLRRQFRRLDLDDVRIVLVDAGDRVLAPFEQPLREHAYAKLRALGVEVRLDRAASGIDAEGVDLTATDQTSSGKDKDPERIDSRTVVWAAGVKPSPLAQQLADATGAEIDHGGRIRVDDHCQVPGHPEIFAIGDLANVHDLPGLAEPAMQEGKHVATVIASRLTGAAATDTFRYRDLGTMATIAPDDAVAQVGPLRLTGWIGKVAWAAVHLAFLVGWGNRLAVMLSWARSVLRGSRRQQVIL